MTAAYLNAIATAVPAFDVHGKFVDYCPKLLPDERSRRLFRRMAERAQIDHRYSILEPARSADKLDNEDFYDSTRGFPTTGQRMARYESAALTLASSALEQLDLKGITHLIVTSCTGFYAPGLDRQIVLRHELDPAIECSFIGFMGCHAAINAMKLARHIVRSHHRARVLLLNLELCTLHLKASGSLEEMLSFLVFADGCAAAIVSAEALGLELQAFNSHLIPKARDQITWRIGDAGFDMHLSGQVPGTIAATLPACLDRVCDGCTSSDIVHWAVHPGGRSVLDAVSQAAELRDEQIVASREVLRRFGNMSSATVMFVLREILHGSKPGPGCALAFGPGLSIESMRFLA